MRHMTVFLLSAAWSYNDTYQNDFLIGIWGGEVESNWVHSAMRPPIGLLCNPRVIIMMKKLME
jgi:hypothetical protein